jgi:hypothetical protein
MMLMNYNLVLRTPTDAVTLLREAIALATEERAIQVYVRIHIRHHHRSTPTATSAFISRPSPAHLTLTTLAFRISRN